MILIAGIIKQVTHNSAGNAKHLLHFNKAQQLSFINLLHAQAGH